MGFIQNLKQYFNNSNKKRNVIKSTDKFILIPLGITPGTPIDYNTIEDLTKYMQEHISNGGNYFIYDSDNNSLYNDTFDENSSIVKYIARNSDGISGLIANKTGGGGSVSLMLEYGGNIYEIAISDGFINLYGRSITIDSHRTIIKNIPEYGSIEDADDDEFLYFDQLYRIGNQIHVK